jgi:hypothetical protein
MERRFIVGNLGRKAMPRRKKSVGFVEAVHNMFKEFRKELEKEDKMPRGKGTYGKKVGRPPKKKVKPRKKK